MSLLSSPERKRRRQSFYLPSNDYAITDNDFQLTRKSNRSSFSGIDVSNIIPVPDISGECGTSTLRRSCRIRRRSMCGNQYPLSLDPCSSSGITACDVTDNTSLKIPREPNPSRHILELEIDIPPKRSYINQQEYDDDDDDDDGRSTQSSQFPSMSVLANALDKSTSKPFDEPNESSKHSLQTSIAGSESPERDDNASLEASSIPEWLESIYRNRPYVKPVLRNLETVPEMLPRQRAARSVVLKEAAVPRRTRLQSRMAPSDAFDGYFFQKATPRHLIFNDPRMCLLLGDCESEASRSYKTHLRARLRRQKRRAKKFFGKVGLVISKETEMRFTEMLASGIFSSEVSSDDSNFSA